MFDNQQIRDLYRYEKTYKNQLGMGAFGEVYKCKRKDGQNDQLCVKIIPKSRNNIKLQKQEIEIIKKIMEIQSENLVRIENVINSPHQFEIIMERCDMDLAQEFELLKASSWYDNKQCVNVVKQIIEGCRVLQENKIVHRDIKPQNILVKIINQGQITERRVYKISDFGFSRILDNFCQPGILTKVGTPIYSSPQVFRNQPYSGKCDIYSQGILFYQIFFEGDLPYKLKTSNSIKDFYTQLEKRQFRFEVSKYPQNELINDLLSKMIVYDEEERISFEQLYGHQLLNVPSSMFDSLFNQLQNVSKKQIKILSQERNKKLILDRLKRIFQIQTQLFRKYLFFESISRKLLGIQEIKKKFAGFCLCLLGIQELLYCIAFMHVIITDIHPFFFIDNKDIDNVKNILQQCSQNINLYPEYQELCKKIKQKYFNFKKSTKDFNNKFISYIKLNQQNLSENMVQQFNQIVNQSNSQRIDRNKLIENLRSLLNQKFLNGFEAEIEKAITLDERFPIQNYKDINPNDIFKEQ